MQSQGASRQPSVLGAREKSLQREGWPGQEAAGTTWDLHLGGWACVPRPRVYIYPEEEWTQNEQRKIIFQDGELEV